MYYNKESVYTMKFDDPLGIFFTEEEFPEIKDAYDDVSAVLQSAIDRLVKEQSYGVLYIPEGEYRLKKTIKIPPSVRLIGYGSKRPLFILPESTEGFDFNTEPLDDPTSDFKESYPGANYMFWFIGDKNTSAKIPKDANAGTFYSAISNIDFKIEAGNPGAVCIRAHFAQHGFISHCHFDLGDGLSGIYDVGNEMEDLTFVGGSYGIICRMCSPGWPFALFDSTFKGQKKAAIACGMTGFTGFRLRISDTPKAFDLYVKNGWEKLYLEDCIFENISEEAITLCQTTNIIQQTNLKNLYCKNVPVLLKKTELNEYINIEPAAYNVCDYGFGYMLTEGGEAKHKEILDVEPLDCIPEILESDIPPLPPMEKWVSVADYGAKGDGETDDTQAIQKAIDSETILYFPQGIYRVTDTITMSESTTLIGISPITTQLIIVDDTPAFSGYGTPKPLLETSKGGYSFINGIGIDTAGKNPRAAGVKWMANEASYMNDVKFVGGHGLMYRDGRNAFGYLYNPTRTADYNPDRLWDYQYSSLWITEGGGIFKDVWSASPYAEAGITITNTESRGRMYAVSLEHHVRSEMKLHNVKNWTFYAIQTEEEKAEGLECLPMELVSCEDITFVNYFIFRVVAVNRPYETAIRTWNCKNITFMNLHNKAQMQYVFTLSLKDENTGFYAKSPEHSRLVITGKSKAVTRKDAAGNYEIIASGFSFAQGIANDSHGNLYWCDKLYKRIYKYDIEKKITLPVLDIHFIPSALAFDTEDNLLVAVDYSELKTTIPGAPFLDVDFTNYHPFFSWFYKRSEKMYSVSPDNAFNTMTELSKIPACECSPEAVIRPAHLDYPGMYDDVISREIKDCYMSIDNKTAVEGTIDLARSLVLRPAKKGSTFLMTDDSRRTSWAYQVDEKGNFILSGSECAAIKGQYNAVVDSEGDVWTVDDMLYGFKNGEIMCKKAVPYDAYTLTSVNGRLYIIGRHNIYHLGA